MPFATIHVNPTTDLPTLAPIRRILLLHWLRMLKDRATSSRHVYAPEFCQLSSCINGNWHDLPPVPDSLATTVGQEIREWINPSRSGRWLADILRRLASRFDQDSFHTIHYSFMLVVDTGWSLWAVTIEDDWNQGRVTFDLLESSDWSRDQAKIILESRPMMEIGAIDQMIR